MPVQRRSGIPILMYHSIDPVRSILSVSPPLFQQQMDWLHRQKFTVISLSELVKTLKDNTPQPECSAVLTFDDAYESLYQHVFPVLKRYGFPASIFIVAGRSGGHNDWPGQPAGIPHLPVLGWNQIREMDAAGIEFGAHTIHHPRLDRLPDDQARIEILGSKRIIEEQLGHSIGSFAYPYGRFNTTIKIIVQSAFSCACGTRVGLVNSHSDPFALERIDIQYLRHPIVFQALSNGLLPYYLHIRRMMRTIRSMLFKRTWV